MIEVDPPVPQFFGIHMGSGMEPVQISGTPVLSMPGPIFYSIQRIMAIAYRDNG